MHVPVLTKDNYQRWQLNVKAYFNQVPTSILSTSGDAHVVTQREVGFDTELPPLIVGRGENRDMLIGTGGILGFGMRFLKRFNDG